MVKKYAVSEALVPLAVSLLSIVVQMLLAEKIGNTTLFKDLATSLAVAGIATVRYDKRTLIYGKEMVADPGLSVEEETIEDALAAAQLLRTNPRINPEKVFIIGHSMGASLAPRIDAEGGNFAGLILMAGTARRLEDVIIDQNAAAMKDLDERARQAAEAQLAPFVAQLRAIYSMTDEEAQATTIDALHVRAYYLKEWGEKPVADYLKDFQKPILVLQGAADFQVSVEADFNAFKAMLANSPQAQFKLYPQLSHVFMTSHFPDIKDFQKEYEVAQNLDQQVATDIIEFIRK